VDPLSYKFSGIHSTQLEV